MTPNPFGQACRYLMRLWALPLLAWLLRLAPAELEFVEWLDTRHVPWPGQPDRTCDTVAHLRDPAEGGLPWAAVVEFQVEPDELMFGRGLSYLGELWQACKPTPHRGDRFCVGLIVVNLTGRGRASRRMRLRRTGLRTELGVAERNLAAMDATKVLREVEAGRAPRGVLAWVPLMKGGGRPGIIPEWRRLAELETDAELRRSLALAEVFAEAARCGESWREALKEWDMIESKLVNEWKAEAALKAKVEAVMDVLEARFGSPPPDLTAAIRACTQLETLRRWTRLAGKATSVEDFRRDAGL